MKFQKGILSDAEKEQIRSGQAKAIRTPTEKSAEPAPLFGDVEKNRLFETQEEFAGSSNHYLKVLGVVGVLVLIVGGIVLYMMEPGVGDRVLPRAGEEAAVRDHFLNVEKRTATDIVFFKCDGFYWARVGVETRTDIPNPIYRVSFYNSRSTPTGEKQFNITAQPIMNAEMDVPCS